MTKRRVCRRKRDLVSTAASGNLEWARERGKLWTRDRACLFPPHLPLHRFDFFLLRWLARFVACSLSVCLSLALVASLFFSFHVLRLFRGRWLVTFPFPHSSTSPLLQDPIDKITSFAATTTTSALCPIRNQQDTAIMGTSDEREENGQRRNQDVQMRQVEHTFPDPASEGGHGGRAYANGGGMWTTDKLGMSGAYSMEVDPTHDGVEHMPMSPNSVANSGYGHQNEYNGHAAYAHQRPVGPVATPITRFLTKQTFGFIPKPSFSHSADSPVCSAPSSPLMSSPTGPGGAGFRLPSLSLGSAPQSPTHSAMGSPQQSFSFSAAETLQRVFGGSSSLPGSPLPGTPTSLPPRNGSFSLPPLKRACLSPSTALPSLPSFSRMSLEDICQPFRYQRSLSCPSDAMVRGMPSEEVMNEPAVAPAFILSPADIPKNRLERSSSVDATSVLAMREAHARVRGMESTHRPESIDLHRWLDHGADRHHSLDSLADSAYSVQAMESEHSSVESPRGLASPRGDFHESDHRMSFASNQGEQRREKKLCAFPECTSNAVTRGLCISHGGGRRCQRKGCTRGAQSKGLCVAHGGGRICRAKGCSNIQRSMGLCIRHGGGKRCSVPGCQKGVVRQDLCTAHGGKRKCKVDDCNKHVKKKGLCRSHANAVFGTSSPRSSSPEFMH